MVHYMEGGHTEERLETLRRKFDPVKDARAVEPVVREIRRLLHGETDALNRKVDLSLVESGFRREVLERLCEIPAGSVLTYQSLAAVSHAPRAQRAVGSAMATNPIPIFVPCHRVVRSDGTVGYYGGGPSLKVRLLRAEGFDVDSHNHLETLWGHRDTRIYCRPQCYAGQRTDPVKMVMFADSEHARRAGMRPCKSCRPPAE